ncbi:MAG: hypothetical protein LBE36_05485 [Flavobacteriaceae bacterium]|jgi:hypothetical protein|nr:hypothetical protein [Flavobacteriaceae bacterium]
MRLSNRRKKPFYSFISTVLLISLLGGVGLFFLRKAGINIFGFSNIQYLLVIAAAALLNFFYFREKQIFEYDSDGEALNFKNENLSLFFKPVKDEFPKYKLVKYEIMKMLFIKKLYITISSKKDNSKVLKYHISFLSSKEIKDLKLSLNRVIKANKENKR